MVRDEEDDNSGFSDTSGEKEAEAPDPIYSHSDDDSEIFYTPPTSPTPTDDVS